jgi:hypothetical protein
VPATEHFTFDLTGALADQLSARLPELTPEPLTTASLAVADEMPGVYQLYRNGELIYVGKADTSLRGRLLDHHRKLAGARTSASPRWRSPVYTLRVRGSRWVPSRCS